MAALEVALLLVAVLVLDQGRGRLEPLPAHEADEPAIAGVVVKMLLEVVLVGEALTANLKTQS